MPDPIVIDPATGERVSGAAPQIDPTTGERVAAKPDLTANPKGEGTYTMWDTSGHKLDVPYSSVPVALGQSFQFDKNRDKSGTAPMDRFYKDLTADPALVGPKATSSPGQFMAPAHTAQSAQASLDAEKSAPALQQLAEGVAKGAGLLTSPVAHVMALGGLAPPAQEYGDAMGANTPLQGAGKYGTVAAAAAPAAFAAPVATAAGLVGGTAGSFAGGAAGQALGLTPGVSQVLSDAGGIAGGAGGAGLASLLPRGIGTASVTDLPAAVKQYVRPSSSLSVVPRTEFAARRLAQAILPATKDASNFIQSAQQEVPNILDYAESTGNPLNTRLEFSKAAKGYAQNVRSLYTDQVLGPNDKLVPTGTDFGRTQGEGPTKYATLSEIDKRIGDINTQLDAPALNADDARRALAGRSGLQAEAAKLRDVLHNNLAQATGLRPEDIADLRQRVGRSWEIANDTDAAVTQQMQAVGKSELKPLKPTEVPGQIINWGRGGPLQIGDRAFQSAIKQFPREAQSLPQIGTAPTLPPAPQRAPIWAGQQPLGHPEVNPPTPDVNSAMALMAQQMANRPSAQGKLFSGGNIDATQRRPAVDPAIVARNQRLLQLLAQLKAGSPNQ